MLQDVSIVIVSLGISPGYLQICYIKKKSLSLVSYGGVTTGYFITVETHRLMQDLCLPLQEMDEEDG